MAEACQPYGITLWILTLLFGSGCALLPEREVQVPWIAREELKAQLGSPEVIILDVRKNPDWETSSQKIPGASHEDYDQVKIWGPKYPQEKTLVLYCA